jgi:pilus assembly protein CpaB
MSSRLGPNGPKLRRLNMGQIFIILAVVSALFTIIIFKSVMSKQKPDVVEHKIASKPVIVAMAEIYPGEVITSSSLKEVQWPADLYPKSDVFSDSGKLVGRVADKGIHAGEPIYRIDLAGEDSRGGLPVVIPDGYRAMTVAVTEIKGVGGFIKPGDHVDVVNTFEVKIPNSLVEHLSKDYNVYLPPSKWVAKPVLQDALVLATAQKMYEDPKATVVDGVDKAAAANGADKPKDGDKKEGGEGEESKATIVNSVTLAVTPEQAAILALAEETGNLRLALRQENYHEVVPDITAVDDDFFSVQDYLKKASLDESSLAGPALAPATETAAPQPTNTIQVYQGENSTTVSF